MIRIVESRNRRAVKALLAPERARDTATERRVAAIVAAVRRDGDRALLRYARRFDRLDGPIEIAAAEMRDAAATRPRAGTRGHPCGGPEHPHGRAAPGPARLARACRRRRQRRAADRSARPRRLLCAGRPLPTSLVAADDGDSRGARRACGEIVVVCPRPEPVVMAAALEAGVSRMFRIGGAHAVAALAYGTRTVPRVDKIVGPGNRYVAAAKALVAADCGIDFYAGPDRDRHRRRPRARRRGLPPT